MNERSPRGILIDTDLAFGSPRADVDDALAILLSLANPDLKVLAITPVGGNVAPETASRNLHALLARLGRSSIPHAWTSSLPIDPACRVKTDRWDRSVEAEPERPADAPSEDSVDVILRTLKTEAEPVTLVTIGPLTNVALALRKDPAANRHISEIVMMGGSFRKQGPYGFAEFNIWADPYAAAIVLGAGVKVTMFGLDVTKKRPVKPEDLDQWDDPDSPLVSALRTSYIDYMKVRSERFREDGVSAFFHDAFPIAYLANPALFTIEPCRITVDLEGALSYAVTLVDFGRNEPPPKPSSPVLPLPHRIALDVDAPALTDYVISTISREWRGAR